MINLKLISNFKDHLVALGDHQGSVFYFLIVGAEKYFFVLFDYNFHCISFINPNLKLKSDKGHV